MSLCCKDIDYQRVSTFFWTSVYVYIVANMPWSPTGLWDVEVSFLFDSSKATWWLATSLVRQEYWQFLKISGLTAGSPLSWDFWLTTAVIHTSISISRTRVLLGRSATSEYPVSANVWRAETKGYSDSKTRNWDRTNARAAGTATFLWHVIPLKNIWEMNGQE
jgi:hypothetical protein